MTVTCPQVACAPPLSELPNKTIELLRTRLQSEYTIYDAAKQKLLRYIEERGCAFQKVLSLSLDLCCNMGVSF